MLLIKRIPPLLGFLVLFVMIDILQLPIMPSRVHLPPLVEATITAFLLLAFIVWLIMGGKNKQQEKKTE